MKKLLDGRFDPITSEFGFVQAPISVVAAWWHRREASIQEQRGGGIEVRELSGELEQTLGQLLPLTSVERRRTLFVSTSSDWTAVFDNGWQGGDAAGLSIVASGLGCMAVRIVAVEDVKVGLEYRRYGARIFELYGAEQTAFMNYVRTISVANDGGRWRIDQFGPCLAGEDASWLRARQVKDRFRLEHMAVLLRSIGIDAFEAGYYAPSATLVSRVGPSAVGCREYSLSEVQAEWAGG